MNEQGGNNTLKIRFRLPNGEEFEAQGPLEFIERERNYFLTLLRNLQTRQNNAAGQPRPTSASTIPVQPFPIGQLQQPGTQTDGIPAFPAAAQPFAAGRPLAPGTPGGANNFGTFQPSEADFHAANLGELRLWERLFKEDGSTLILRQKAKLPAAEMALLILAGARVLFKNPAYPALELARSLKACGINGGRLDRLLLPEIQSGRLIGAGTKRSRTYRLTEEGFAKAFVLAEKLIRQI